MPSSFATKSAHQEAYDLLAPKSKLHPSEEWIWSELLDAAIGLQSDSLTVVVRPVDAKRYRTHRLAQLYRALGGSASSTMMLTGAMKILEEGCYRH